MVHWVGAVPNTSLDVHWDVHTVGQRFLTPAVHIALSLNKLQVIEVITSACTSSLLRYINQ